MDGGRGIKCETAVICLSLDLTEDKSTLVHVMVWCRQATSHYLSQCWPRSLPPYGVTRPQWVNIAIEKVLRVFPPGRLWSGSENPIKLPEVNLSCGVYHYQGQHTAGSNWLTAWTLCVKLTVIRNETKCVLLAMGCQILILTYAIILFNTPGQSLWRNNKNT